MRMVGRVALLGLLGLGLPVAAESGGERIVTYDPLTRKDVPHYRAHVLDAARLTPLSEEDTEINVTVFPAQVQPGGDTFVFSGHRGSQEARYQVTAQSHLTPQAVAPVAQPEYRMVQVDPRKDDWLLERGEQTILAFTWSLREEGSSQPPQTIVPFNGGKSLLLSDLRSLLVPDVSAPKLVHLPKGLRYSARISPDGKAVVGLENLGSRRTDKEIYWTQGLARSDASGKVTRSQPLEERKASEMFEDVAFVPEAGLILALGEKTVVAFDDAMLRQRWAVPCSGRDFRGLVKRPDGKHWALIGKDLIELESQRVLLHVEELFPVARSLLTPQALYWAGAGDPKAFMHMTTLHRIDLGTLKESAAYTLTPGRDTSDDLSTVRSIHALPGNRLLVLTGSQVMFMDHSHVRE